MQRGIAIKEIEILNSNINVAKSKIQNNEENKERFNQEIEEIKQSSKNLHKIWNLN